MSAPITPDLRSKVLNKFQELHGKLQTLTTPEQLENSCYEKGNNDRETYIKLCNNLVSNRTKQLEESQKTRILTSNQVRGVINPNFRPNMNQTNNGVVSDPINALRNLTVTAGQANQMNLQQANIRMNSQAMNSQGMIQMNPNAQQPQRFMVAGNRTIDQFQMQQHQQMTQPSNPQMMTQIHGMNTMNVNQSNTIRLNNKNGSIKPETSITQNQSMQQISYQMDANGVLVRPFYPGQINNQHMNNIMQSSIRPPISRIIQNSPVITNVLPQHQSPQDHYAMSNQIPQQSITIIQPITSNQQEEMAPQQNIPPNNVPVPQSATAPSAKPQISEEEMLKVKEELAKISFKYFRYLKIALENPSSSTAETHKIWAVLKDLLDVDKPCLKPITLKHTAKILIYSEKAEEYVLANNLDPTKQTVAPSSEEIFGKRVIPDRNKIGFNSESAPSNLDVLGGSSNVNSLDVAFDDVIHQIKKQKVVDKRKVRDSLIHHIKTEKSEFLRYIPKFVQNDSDHLNNKENDSEYDEKEFDFIDAIPTVGLEIKQHWTDSYSNTTDGNGLLRTDRDSSHFITNSGDVNSDLQLLRKEFVINIIDPQPKTQDWVSRENDWDNSSFYSIQYKKDEFPAEISPIIVRVPEDYEHSLSVDWNLNLKRYPTGNSSDADVFLTDVETALQDEFSNLNSHPWNGVPLLGVVSIYKRSISIGFSNYECRKSIYS